MRLYTMLPLSPADQPELSSQQEDIMAQDLAQQFNEYVSEELVGVLADMAMDVLKDNNIDPASAFGYDLIHDLINRIVITAK